MRESGGPIWMPHSGPTGGMWLFTRYDDVLAIFKEARIGKDLRRVLPDAQQGPFDVHMLNVDPPDHTRLRSLVNIAFTPKRIKDLEPSIRQITNDLLDEILVRGGEIEFVRDFAFPLPVIVIAELLGVPPHDRDQLRKWSLDLIEGMDATRKNRQEAEAGAQAATLAMGEYFEELVAKRRQEPRADLISAMIQSSLDQDRLSENELIGTCILLLVAGHETTVNLLGTGC
jgi:cytochrome P450